MRGRTIFLIVAVLIAIGGIALINNNTSTIGGVKPTNPPPPAAAAAPPKPITPSAPTTDTSALITELTVGNPKAAKAKVTLGYTADDTVAEHTDIARAAINAASAWANQHPNASLQVICVDIPTDQRTDPSTANVPVGLAVNGVLLPGMDKNIGTGGLSAADIVKALNAIPA